MSGFGKMTYKDKSTYEGNWEDGMMHGDGLYIDKAGMNWNGIFVKGVFDSKIQKKLQAEKQVRDK